MSATKVNDYEVRQTALVFAQKQLEFKSQNMHLASSDFEVRRLIKDAKEIEEYMTADA